MRSSSLAAHRARPLAVGLGAAIALGIAPAAHADRGDYVARSFNEPARLGLAVTGPLSDLVAVSRARVTVPAEWRSLRAQAGQLRFITPGAGCRYRVTFSARSRIAEPGDAAARVAAGLPSPGPRYLLDAGQRRRSAFRVIRRQGGAVVRLDGLSAAVLTRRSDIVPAGQVAWSDLRVTAASQPGDECHSGTWRERLGPQLADALVTARTRLHFVRKPSAG